MCDCLLVLVKQGFVERETTYENEDFVEKGFLLRKYKMTSEGIKDARHVFHLNYCPACGKKIDSPK